MKPLEVRMDGAFRNAQTLRDRTVSQIVEHAMKYAQFDIREILTPDKFTTRHRKARRCRFPAPDAKAGDMAAL